MAKEKQPYSSILDAFLDSKAPDFDALDLADAKKSGEEVADRTHQYADEEWLNDLAESSSHHTPVWGPKSGTHAYEQRISEKESAAPRVNAVKADWRKDARRDQEAYNTQMGDNDSLMNEVTESIESAYSNSNLAENSADKREVSDAQVFKYVKDLLNQGTAPSKIAVQLQKLAEIELFNHQSATDYLQRNAGLLGLAYIEPNTFLDKSSPTYEHTASKKTATSYKVVMEKNSSNACRYATAEEAKAAGQELFSRWMGMPSDWRVEPSNDPVNYRFDQEQYRSVPIEKTGSSNDCVAQKRAWDKAGIKPQARSVKQVSACSDCAYFKQANGSKTCNLYHLPVVANAKELSQIVNHLTPGVPEKRKHAALVQIANGDGKRVQNLKVAEQTNVVKAADAKVRNQSKRASYEYGDAREQNHHFAAEHVAKMHDKGASLEQIYKWASEKFGDVDTSIAFRGFVQSFKKDAKGKLVVASADLSFLNSIGIRNESYIGAAKCASCPTHFNREAREAEQDRGVQRVDQKFVSRTASAVRGMQQETEEITLTAGKVRKLHQAGHSVEKIYVASASKVGSVQAKKAVAGFIEGMKKHPGKIAVSESDRAFLVGKLGFKPEQVRMLDPLRRPVTQVVASVPDDQHLLSYPGMGKHAGEKKATDGHAILAEFDLTGSHDMSDIDTSGHKLGDVEMGDHFKMDTE